MAVMILELLELWFCLLILFMGCELFASLLLEMLVAEPSEQLIFRVQVAVGIVFLILLIIVTVSRLEKGI